MTNTVASRALAIALALSASAAFAAGTSPATPPTPIQLGSTAYTQNFDDSLQASGSSTYTALPAGWRIYEGAANGNGSYVVGNGSSNTGNIYSYGTTGSSDRALGSLTSGNLDPAIFGAYFANNTGTTITSLAVSYLGELWRRGMAVNDTLNFSYYIGTPDVLNGTTGWTDVSLLNFVSPQTGAPNSAIDGNSVNTLVQATIGNLSIGAGSTFAIRWQDNDLPASDDGLAIDNVSITANPAATSNVPETATWAMMVLGFGLLGTALRRRKVAFA